MGKDDAYVNLTHVEGVVVAEDVVPAPTVHLIEVIAPSDLDEGYKFEAEANGQRFIVVVVSFEEGSNFSPV